PDNRVELLERASGKNKREIEQLVAALAPQPDVPSRMRKLPEPGPTQSRRASSAPSTDAVQSLCASQAPNPAPLVDAVQPTCAPEEGLAAASVRADQAPPFALEAPRHRASSAPLSPGRYKVEFTANEALHDKLQQ